MGVRVYIPYWLPIAFVVATMAWVSYAGRASTAGA